MKPKYEFEYVAHERYEESQLKKFNRENRNNISGVKWWVISALTLGCVIAIGVITLLGSVIDSLPVWFWTCMTLIMVAFLLLVVPIITRYGK